MRWSWLSVSPRWFVLPLAAFVLLAAAPPGARPTLVNLAVVRSDGILVPFATFDGKNWSTRWPLADKIVNVPVSLDHVPSGWWKPRVAPVLDWWFTPLTGEVREPQRLRVAAPIGFPTQCQVGVGLRINTTFSSPPPPLDVQPYPKDGLAVAPQLDVEPIEAIEEGSDEWKEVTGRLVPAINTEEAETVRHAVLVAPLVPRAFRDYTPDKVPPKIERLYRATGATPDTRVYYFEAVKFYGTQPPNPDVCDWLTAATGWLMRDDTGWQEPSIQVRPADCSMSGVHFMLPFGILRIGDRRYWIVQWSTWGLESYAVMELRKREIPHTVFEVPGGGLGECAEDAPKKIRR